MANGRLKHTTHAHRGQSESLVPPASLYARSVSLCRRSQNNTDINESTFDTFSGL